MRILLTTDVVHAGGAETFVLRLGQALATRGHHVVITPLYKNRIDEKILAELAPEVRVVPVELNLLKPLQLVDGLLRRAGIDHSFLTQLFSRGLARIINYEKVQVVHSHLFTTDKVAVVAGKIMGVPVVTTIHGDYSANERLERIGNLKHILNFRSHMYSVLNGMNAIVCICEEQLQFFGQRRSFFGRQLPLHKIYNGYSRPDIEHKPNRQKLGIPAEAFVYGMIARGIPEKGWLQAITAFNNLPDNDSYLLLIGDSAYVQKLKDHYVSKRVLFVGQQEQPFGWLQICEVGLFCSLIKTEALPTVIIEYLAAGLPVIATAVGEVPRMIYGQNGAAGILIPLDEATIVTSLTTAMAQIKRDLKAYYAMQAQTALAFDKFSMGRCVKAYETIYDSCLVPTIITK
ncbi:Glycosyltransferase involved in cell wall bisynthesis [Cnuella takakiae]|uniref:Glycosyltransferase involved in cell wall bisynthesis n=1 Tax=Cnuella takakiae TaxID=1302690 RepID=A0A1M5DRQ7_9BACT|nr:glycosyltransferase [Cnuella takakiae]OLY93892.1 hypothetical protein BUE76_19910 [Cnuella takakiae]SHF69663.1 Glycosyltransferase involved in cell wall bisynthesis [Cnuella takakiae]